MDDAGIFSFAHDLEALFGLLVALPSRLFDGDLGRFCEAVGITARQAALMARLPDPAPCYGRADAYHDGTGLKLLEFNVGSEIGGIDTAHVALALTQVDAFRAFAEENELAYVDTGKRVTDAIRAAAEPLTGGTDPVVALVEPDGLMHEYLEEDRSFQQMLSDLGLDTLLGEVGELQHRAGRLHLHGRPVDIVLRYFTEKEIAGQTASERAVEMVARAHEEGRVVLWTTMRSKLAASKACFGLLSDSRCREAFSADEIALIERVLPWTRILDDVETEVEGQTVRLLEYCREARTGLLIKPHLGHDGVGIVAGWRVTDAEWRDALESAAAAGAIVQRRVISRPEPMIDPESGEVEHWGCTWSVFVVPDGYAGTTMRTVTLDNRSERRCLAPIFQYPASTYGGAR
ncbi:hypothetical protein [Amycolatopsis aidingensis]|uniref:hypothetical protein n=1 Tax=Amycolatopsis aidingensis TaxID=2842453 RepID=UPI001C0D158B|nr:hypothetical protein [Amycolatopsis aidingensis]